MFVCFGSWVVQIEMREEEEGVITFVGHDQVVQY